VRLYVCVCIFLLSACFNIAYLFLNTLLPRSSSTWRMSTTTAEEVVESWHEENISQSELLTIPGVCITARINNPLLLWVWADTERVMEHEEVFLSIGFFLSFLYGTLRSMTIERYGHLFPAWEHPHSLVINPTICTSDCDNTSCGRYNPSSWNSCQSQLT